MKVGRKVISFALVCMMLLVLAIPAAAKTSRVQKRYNVVFVTDESGSMKYTDAEKYRYDAIRLFVALMTQHGNYLGSVTFDDAIMDSNPLQKIDGFEDKEAFMEHISSFPPRKDTNIGLALMNALDLLDAAENTDNPSVIILLSDGKTDVKPEEAMEESLKMKAEAIDRARKSGYKIYTICLNSNGEADENELKQIAQATGGEFCVVKEAEHLKNVQTMFYSIIFDSIMSEKEQLTIGSEGYVEKKFLVPAIGVEELNVILDGDAESYTLTDGNKIYSAEELQKMSMRCNDLVVIKKVDPVGGWWTIWVYGDPGAKIDFQLVYNSDLYLESAVTPGSDYKLGQTARFQTVIHDRNGAVTDPEKYIGFSAKLHLTVNGEEELIDMDLGEGGFYKDIELDTEGTYKAYMTVTAADYSGQTDETYELNINNNAPVFTGETLSDHAWIWPFFGGRAVVDLEGSAQDPDGNPITYSVKSSAFMEEDYTLDGTRLEVHNFSISKGSFEILASDPYGASCVVPVEITSFNVGMALAVLIVVAVVVVFISIGFITYKANFIPFMGTITVSSFGHDSYNEAKLTPSRGSVKLTAFGLGTCGFESKACFKAGGKDRKIYFKSSKPVYSSITNGPQKKITINGNGLEVAIYLNSNKDEGINVKFESILNSSFMMDQF